MNLPLSFEGPRSLRAPPRGGLLDRLARWLEGGGQGSPLENMLELASVLGAQELLQLPEPVVSFYRNPRMFRVSTGVRASRWSDALLRAFAALTRQSLLPEGSSEFEGYPVSQLLYSDEEGRAHWDRYVLVQGAWRRLFIARIAGTRGRVDETFIVYGVPIRLSFAASVDAGALTLKLVRRWSSPAAWLTTVEYRSTLLGAGVRTQGDFRVPLLGFRVRTEFRAVARDAGADDLAR